MNWFHNQEISEENAKNPTDDIQHEEVSSATKLKVIGALLLVGLSAGVAWWVQDNGTISQDPSSLKADVLSELSDSQIAAQTLTEAVTETTQGQANPAPTTEENGFTQEITISNFSFSPSEITIAKGQTVTWKNNDSVAHTVTGPDFTSTTLNSGDSFTYTFQNDATIEYHCSFHPQMKGTIVVGSGSDTELHTAAMEDSEEIDLSNLSSSLTDSELIETADMEDNLSPAALEEIPTIPTNNSQPSGNSLESEPLGGDEQYLQQPPQANVEGGKLPQSGPEDWLYVGLAIAVLYFTGKKFTKTAY